MYATIVLRTQPIVAVLIASHMGTPSVIHIVNADTARSNKYNDIMLMNMDVVLFI